MRSWHIWKKAKGQELIIFIMQPKRLLMIGSGIA